MLFCKNFLMTVVAVFFAFLQVPEGYSFDSNYGKETKWVVYCTHPGPSNTPMGVSFKTVKNDVVFASIHAGDVSFHGKIGEEALFNSFKPGKRLDVETDDFQLVSSNNTKTIYLQSPGRIGHTFTGCRIRN